MEENTEYVLVKFDTNWADEMDIEGFAVCTKESWQEGVDALDENDFPKEFYFGTNESNEYESKEDLLSEYTVTDITEEEYKILKKLFGSSYGGFKYLD